MLNFSWGQPPPREGLTLSLTPHGGSGSMSTP